MSISQLRKDIKKLSQPILADHGFNHVGEMGESIKIIKNGNRLAILIDEIKDSHSFSISVRVFIYYVSIEAIFPNLATSNSYTLNKLLANESISFDSCNSERIQPILNKLISIKAMDFFNEFSLDSSIITNLTSADHQLWVTSDRVTLFKVKLASAALNNDRDALASIKKEAFNYCSKPWSVTDKEVIQELCAYV